MKIVFIISSLGAGGAEKVLSLMSEYFVKKYELFIITFGDKNSYFKLPKNIKVISLNQNKISINLFDSILNNFYRIRMLRKVLHSISPNIAISFMTETNIISILATRWLSIPLIVTEHTCYIWQKSKFWNLLRRFLYPLAEKVTLLTHKDMKNHYRFLKNCAVMPNPFDFAPNSIRKKEKLILGVGRLIPDKGFDELIEAFVKTNNQEYKLKIVGDGVDRKRLEELINKLNCAKNVKLLGQQYNIYEYFERAEIFVLTSHIEGLSNALIEALSMGCAVISYDCPYGPSEVIKNEENGILIPLFDKDRLCIELKRMMNDDGLRKKLSKNALRVREKYSLDLVMSAWETLLFSIIKK
ncbi:MAG: glycosyltransferase family 4 protein [Wolinella sp.]